MRVKRVLDKRGGTQGSEEMAIEMRGKGGRASYIDSLLLGGGR